MCGKQNGLRVSLVKAVSEYATRTSALADWCVVLNLYLLATNYSGSRGVERNPRKLICLGIATALQLCVIDVATIINTAAVFCQPSAC